MEDLFTNESDWVYRTMLEHFENWNQFPKRVIIRFLAVLPDYLVMDYSDKLESILDSYPDNDVRTQIIRYKEGQFYSMDVGNYKISRDSHIICRVGQHTIYGTWWEEVYACHPICIPWSNTLEFDTPFRIYTEYIDSRESLITDALMFKFDTYYGMDDPSTIRYKNARKV